METFSEWLEGLLEERGWSRAEAARRGGISASMYDKVIKQESNPGPKFCMAVARAFDLDLDYVLEKAGKGKMVSKPKKRVNEQLSAYDMTAYTEELRRRIDQTIEDYLNEIGLKRVK